MADITFDPVDVARQFLYVREAQAQGQNRGLRVEGIQHWAMGTFGDSWCDEFAVGFVLDICFQGDSPFPRQSDVEDSTMSGSCRCSCCSHAGLRGAAGVADRCAGRRRFGIES